MFVYKEGEQTNFYEKVVIYLCFDNETENVPISINRELLQNIDVF